MKNSILKSFTLVVSLCFTITNGFSQIPPGYYDTAAGLTGIPLKTALYNIIKGQTVYPYTSSGTDVWDMLKQTDKDPNNPANVILLYTGWSVDAAQEYNSGSGWTREHCWPKSHGFPLEEQPAYTDAHHLRPADVSVNSARNSRWYAECNEQYWDQGGTIPTDSWTSSTLWVWKPRDAVKGDCARMIFYMATRYEGEYNATAGVTEPDLEILDYLPADNNSPLPEMAKLSDLLAWSEQDPVDDFERNRNEVIYGFQGNRNPYIDHPEYVCKVFGSNCPGSVENPSPFTATGVTSTQINLAWGLNANSDNVVVAWNTTNTFGTPSGTYAANDPITGGGTVLYVGSATNFSHTGLSQQTYYYKIWSYDAVPDYSSGVEANAHPLKPEPTNNPTNFIVTGTTFSTIDLSWTDVSTGIIPDGYLIKASTGSITDPVDGTPESDATFVKNVAQGVGVVTFTGLSPSTTYNFKIYPYTNSGATINYKTNTPQSTSGTTNTVPASCATDLIISEYGEGSSYNKWVEIYNRTGSVVDLTNYRIIKGTNGAAYSSSVTLIGTLADDNVYVISHGSANASILALADQTSSVLSFNGNDAIGLQKTTDGGTTWITIDVVGQEGVDPGTGWAVAGTANATYDHTIVRKSSVTTGNTNWASSAGTNTTDSEWTVYATDYISNLGAHTMDCAGASNDANSIATVPTTQVPGGNISSVFDTNPEAMDVFKFNINDIGTSDGVSTIVTNIRIVPGASNTADWTDHIQGVTLNDGAPVIIGTPTITDLFIDIPIAVNNLAIADGTSKEITLAIYLNTSLIVDGDILSFMIDGNSHGFTADLSGSDFGTTFPANVVSNDFTVDVTATQLSYIQQPTNTTVNVGMTPAVSVEATDVNGNRDLSFTSSVSITSSGTMTGSPVSSSAVSGVATFSGLTHSVVGTGLTLTAASTGLLNAISSAFDIISVSACSTDLIISEYVEGLGDNKYLEIANYTGSTVDLSNYELRLYVNGSATPTNTDALSGTLADKSVIVYGNTSATIYGGAFTSSPVCNFSGNDAVALYNSSTGQFVDIIGEIGADPGTAWTSGAYSTMDKTLVRKLTVHSGVSVNPTGFPTLTTEWNVYDLNNVSNLGTHTVDCGSTLDNDSEVQNPASQVAAGTIFSIYDTPPEAVPVFKFNITDLGTGDGENTIVTNIRVFPGASNTASWSNHIQGVILETGGSVITTNTPVITDTYIDIPLTAGSLVVTDGTSSEIAMSIYLNTTNIVDGSVLSFIIDADNHNFAADIAGSLFTNIFTGGDVLSNDFTIDVQATELRFVQQSTDTEVNLAMTPDVTVQATDENGNSDTGFTANVSLSSTGTLTGDPVTVAAVGGLATFTGLTHTVTGDLFCFTASSTGMNNGYSDRFTIFAPTTTIIYEQDFDLNVSWTYTDDVVFFDNSWGSDGYYGIIDIAAALPLNYANLSQNILGENDLNDEGNGTSDVATVDFSDANLSGYTDCVLTFDWDIVGYNASTDDAYYEVFYDGVGQGQVFLVDGGVTGPDAEGTVTVNIPNTVTTFDLHVMIKDDGATGYSGFDNFKLTGKTVSSDFTWQGDDATLPNDWQTAANWDQNSVPAAGNNVIIPVVTNYPIIDDDDVTAVCKNLTIQNGANVTIATNGQMTVSGNVVNNTGAGGLIIQSDITGDGSLIINNPTAFADVQRFLQKSNTEAGQWHTVSSPLTVTSKSLFDLTNFYFYDEAQDDWWTGANYSYAGTSGWQKPSGNLNSDLAYMYYYPETTINYSGTLQYNPSGISIPLSYTTHAGNAPNLIAYTNYDGWNLVPNPYTSAIDWSLLSLTNVDNTVYYYDDAADNFKYFNVSGGTYNSGITVNGGSQFIPAMQGFYVKANNTAGGNITIPTSARVHNNQAFVKDNQASPSFIKIKISDASHADETVVRFDTNAGIDFDNQLDAYKRFSYNIIVPQIYSYTTDNKYAINSFDENDLSSLALGIRVNANTALKFEVPELTISNYDIYLHDILLNSYTLLSGKTNITLNVNAGTTEDRFELVFEKNTVSNVFKNAENSIYVFPNPAKDYIRIKVRRTDNKISKYSVKDLTGRVLIEKKISKEQDYNVNVSELNSGVYFIDMKLQNGITVTKKIIIRD